MNIVSKPSNQAYLDNWEKIFGKKNEENSPEPQYPWPTEADVLGEFVEEVPTDGC